jgi:hypothetical protein
LLLLILSSKLVQKYSFRMVLTAVGDKPYRRAVDVMCDCNYSADIQLAWKMVAEVFGN